METVTGAFVPQTNEAVNLFSSDVATPSHLGVNTVQSLQECDSSVEYNVCTLQGSLPNTDQKQSKRNYISLLGRDVIALSGLNTT